MQYLEFAFQSFWHFVGCWFLLAVFFIGVGNVLRSLMIRNVPGPIGPRGDCGPCGPMGMQGEKGDVGVCNCKCNDLKH